MQTPARPCRGRTRHRGMGGPVHQPAPPLRDRRRPAPRTRNQPPRSAPAPTGGWSQHAEPPPIPERFTPARTQRTVTLPTEAGAQLWQPLQYGTAEWQRVHSRLRNAVEGMNGFGKDPLYERREPGATRRIRGVAAHAVLLASPLAHANKRKLATWAGSVPLHDNRPHRRPTRRRKTEPLGTRTSEGYLTETTA